jgi:hypothetical protein
MLKSIPMQVIEELKIVLSIILSAHKQVRSDVSKAELAQLTNRLSSFRIFVAKESLPELKWQSGICLMLPRVSVLTNLSAFICESLAADAWPDADLSWFVHYLG